MKARVNRTNSAAALAFALIVSGPATATTVWDESVNGALSGNPLAPTALTFTLGSNDVIGEAGEPTPNGPLAPFGQDFFTFTVPTGFELKSLTAVSVDLFTPGDDFAFIGLETGPQITHDVSPPLFGGSATGLLGWRHVASSDQGADILPAMGVAGMGATGFAGPLGAGQYSVWVEDDKPFSYDFSFKIAAVPEASTWAMMLIGFAGLGYAGYRRARRAMSTPAQSAPTSGQLSGF
jgi:hypothetical protein